MSQGDRIPLDRAFETAVRLVEMLAPSCERIAIAGSIRRRRAEVGDIELVAIPRVTHYQTGLFSDIAEPVDELAERIAALPNLPLRSVPVHRSDGRNEIQTRDGRSYKALEFEGVPVDLFICTPETWGVIFALRTGPGEWNTRLVTDCQRYFRTVADGRVLYHGKPVPTPEERDFFAAIGQPWVEPWDRHVGAVAIQRPAS